MTHAHIEAVDGVTGEMLLGALVDAGASIERIEAAVQTLGVGTARLAWARVRRGGREASSVRVRAPEETPDVGSWERVRAVLSFAALPDPVRDCAVEATERLVTAEATAAGVEVDALELPPVGVLDTLATVVSVCAAVHELGCTSMTIGPIGLGTGEVDTFAGPVEATPPAVRELLAGFETVERPVAARLTTATGAALVATLARPGAPPPQVDRVGVGAGDRHAPTELALRVLLAGA